MTDESFCKDDFKPNPLSRDVTGESPRPAMQRISLPIILIIVVVSVLGLAAIALLARFAISRVKERYVSFKHFKYTSHIFRNGQVTSTKMVTTKNAIKMINFLVYHHILFVLDYMMYSFITIQSNCTKYCCRYIFQESNGLISPKPRFS